MIKYMKNKLMIACLCTVFFIAGLMYFDPGRKKTIRVGFYVGSSWNVPEGNSYHIIQEIIKKYEQKYPHVKVSYEGGITKSDYSRWLSEKIISGYSPDVFIIPEGDFNLLSSTKALENLDNYLKTDYGINRRNYFDTSWEAGTYDSIQYALPFESNPVMMCVNKDLLKKENIRISSSWNMDDFYKICQKMTKDTNNDGIIDQYGICGYSWQQAVSAYGAELFDSGGTQAFFNSQKVKYALTMYSKIKSLSKQYNVTSDDFDKGHVAFMPMSLAEYRTYKPYPYRVSKYSKFSWDCIPMPSNNHNKGLLKTSLVAISSNSSYKKEAWEFLKLMSSDNDIQQNLFETSQGVSVLKSVMNSSQTKSFLKRSAFEEKSLDIKTINTIMNNTKNEPKFKKYDELMRKADYYITKSLDDNSLELELSEIQRIITNNL